jgi:hypothetical protein
MRGSAHAGGAARAPTAAHCLPSVMLFGAAHRRNRGGRKPYVTDCWYTVKPIAAHTAATIQKRRMIFVSDHPRISKW